MKPSIDRVKRTALGLALIGSSVAGTFAATATTQAAPETPDTCHAFVHKYLESGLPDGSSTPFSLVTHSTRIGTAIGPIGAVPLRPIPSLLILASSTRPIAVTELAGEGEQYFSDRMYTPPAVPGFVIGEPFSPDATDHVGVSVRDSYGTLNVGLKLKSWDDTRVKVVPQGCVGDSLLYGTADGSLVSIAFGELEPPPAKLSDS